MKTLVLGSSGLLGSYLYRLAKAQKRNVSGLSRSKMKFTDVQCDAEDQHKLEQIIETGKFDVVVNAIKYKGSTDQCETDQKACWKINSELPAFLAKLQKRFGFLLVQVSTDWVFEGKDGQVYSEDSPVHPVNYYAESKLAAEKEVEANANQFLIVRTTGIFGFEEPARNTFARFLAAAKAGEEFGAATDQFSQPISCLELSKIIYELIDKNATGVFIADGKDYVSRFELAKRIAKFFKIDETLVSARDSAGRAIKIPKFLKADVSKAENAIGRKIPNLEEQFHELKDFENQA